MTKFITLLMISGTIGLTLDLYLPYNLHFPISFALAAMNLPLVHLILKLLKTGTIEEATATYLKIIPIRLFFTAILILFLLVFKVISGMHWMFLYMGFLVNLPNAVYVR